jgi:hypothetical protein
VKYSNDDHSFREKFCLVIWIGEEVKVMRRAKVSLGSGLGIGRFQKGGPFEVGMSENLGRWAVVGDWT